MMGSVRALGRLLFVFALSVARAAYGQDSSPALVFDPSADHLPKEAIRAAVERELGRPLEASPDTASSELAVAVDPERGLIVRYRTSRGSIERFFPMPARIEDVPLVVSLAAGNLARDPSAGIERPRPAPEIPTTLSEEPQPSSDAPAQTAPGTGGPAARPASLAPAPHPPRLRKNWLGLRFAQDVALLGGSNVCDPNLGQMSENFACFYEGSSDEPFFHTPYPDEDGITTGPVLATSRLLVSYEHAFTPSFTVGMRLGYAFGGGPPAGQAPRERPASGDLNSLPARAKGRGGQPFLPLHLELRSALWFIPLDRDGLRAYAGASFGVAQVDARVVVPERDCAATLEPSWNIADGTFADCRRGASSFNRRALPETRVDAWKKLGNGFIGLDAGGLLALSDSIGAMLEVKAMFMLPSNGIVLQPSLGIAAGL